MTATAYSALLARALRVRGYRASDMRDLLDSVAPAAARMSKSTSQTLTTAIENTITFDVEEFDTDGSLVDLANNRFVIQQTGIYLLSCAWLWEATAPAQSAYINFKQNGADFATLGRTSNVGDPNGGHNHASVVSLAAADNITVTISPGSQAGVTARGNAAPQIATSFAIARFGLPL